MAATPPAEGRYRRGRVETTGVASDLHLLGEMDDFQVADDEVDPRGWDVVDADGNALGRITGLLASPTTWLAYYAVVEGGEHASGRDFVLPLEPMRFDTDNRVAVAPYTRARVAEAPVYEPESRDYDRYHTYWSGPVT